MPPFRVILHHLQVDYVLVNAAVAGASRGGQWVVLPVMDLRLRAASTRPGAPVVISSTPPGSGVPGGPELASGRSSSLQIQGLVQCVEVVPGPAIPRGRLGSPWDGSPIEGRALGDPFYTRSIP